MITMDPDLVKEMVQKHKRTDKRDFESYRNVQIKTGVVEKAAGSAEACIGNTRVIAGVKIETGEPFEDTPEEGGIMVNAEFVPFSHESTESGPPRAEAIEVARVVDRTIRESKCIDLEKLVIEPGEKIWNVFIDVDVIDNDGNLHDAVELAAITALLDSKFPVMDKEGNPDYEKFKDPLPVNRKPVSVSICKIDGNLLVDPNFLEEEAYDARLTMGLFKEDGEYKFCSLQKGGESGFTSEELHKCFDLAIEKCDKLLELVENAQGE